MINELTLLFNVTVYDDSITIHEDDVINPKETVCDILSEHEIKRETYELFITLPYQPSIGMKLSHITNPLRGQSVKLLDLIGDNKRLNANIVSVIINDCEHDQLREELIRLGWIIKQNK